MHGLESGADDYLAKPFALRELVLRVRSLTRRAAERPPAFPSCTDVVMDLARREVRTPVAVMRGSVEVAEHGSGGLDAHLPRTRRAADRMADVVENLLTRGQLEAAVDSVRAEPLRLDPLVEEACADLPEGGHRLEPRLEESVVDADAALVRVAVRNLLDNAVRHGRTPGAPDRAELLVTVRGPEVSVADRGPGVEPGRLPELMERFRSPGGGTGIGLSLVHRVALARRGSLSVRTRTGGGAVFVLRLAPPGRSAGGRGRADAHDSLMTGRS